MEFDMDSNKFSNYVFVRLYAVLLKSSRNCNAVCSTAVRRWVSRALSFLNHSGKRHSAMRKCVFFSMQFCDVVLVLFCDLPTCQNDLCEEATDLHQILLQTRQDGFGNTQNA